MNQTTRWYLPLLLIAVLLLAACGGSSPPAPAQEEDDSATVEETVAPTATTAPTATPQPSPTPEPTEEPAAPVSEARTLDEIEDIESFRVRVSIKATGDAFADDEELAMMASGMTMEGEFVKEPPAQHLRMELPGLGTVEFIQIDDAGYGSFGGTWVATPVEDLPNLDDLTLISPAELGRDIDKFERVGSEELSGRSTTHYRADQELLATLDTGEAGGLGFENAEQAQLDLWVDDEEGFIVKMELTAEGKGINEDLPDAEGSAELSIEYFDFNEEITIEAPAVDETLSITPPAIEEGDLATLLGFELELPDATDSFAFGTIGSVTVPLSTEEASELVRSAFEANGYTMNEDESFIDAGIYAFKLDNRTVSVFVSEADGGGTEITFSVSE